MCSALACATHDSLLKNPLNIMLQGIFHKHKNCQNNNTCDIYTPSDFFSFLLLYMRKYKHHIEQHHKYIKKENTQKFFWHRKDRCLHLVGFRQMRNNHKTQQSRAGWIILKKINKKLHKIIKLNNTNS